MKHNKENKKLNHKPKSNNLQIKKPPLSQHINSLWNNTSMHFINIMKQQGFNRISHDRQQGSIIYELISKIKIINHFQNFCKVHKSVHKDNNLQTNSSIKLERSHLSPLHSWAPHYKLYSQVKLNKFYKIQGTSVYKLLIRLARAVLNPIRIRGASECQSNEIRQSNKNIV